MVHRRRRPGKRKKIPATQKIIGTVLVLLLGFLLAQFAPSPDSVTSEEGGIRQVERCVDGDTIVLVGGERVRFIGVDTPETVKPNTPVQPFGPEASAFTKNEIARNGNKVRLVYDGDTKDRYGRTLAHIYLGDVSLNEELLRSGLGKAQLQYRYSREMKDRYQRAEDEAKRNKRGMWKDFSTAP